MHHLLKEIFNYSEHRSSIELNAISVTTVIGAKYKASLQLAQIAKDESLIADELKRSSSIGSGFHLWAERALKDNPDIESELYREKRFGKYLITGSCDILETQLDGTQRLMDIKTGYGKERKEDALLKDKLQMSLYKWLLSDDHLIDTVGTILFVSQSNNVTEAYEMELLTIKEMEKWLDDRFMAIEKNEGFVDCNQGVKYNPCNYCNYMCEQRR